MKCRFIDTGHKDAYTNMAIDESILNFCKKPTLRVYQWTAPSISVGYNQNVGKEINFDNCKKHKVPIVRRITGGKAVLHDKEVTYSFILPENLLEMPRDILKSYKVIAQALVLAFETIGIKAIIQKQPQKLATPICFNSSNWYELTVNNKKISGSAQRRLKGKILQHGPLLIDFDYEKNAMLFPSDNAKELAEGLKKRITSIKRELGIDVSYNEMVSAIKHGFQKNFKFDFFEDELTNEEKKLADTLKKEKYSTDTWNLKT